MQVVTKNNLENFTEKLLKNDKEIIDNLSGQTITSDRIDGELISESIKKLTLGYVENSHIGGNVGSAIQSYSSTRCYAFVPLTYDKIKFYWEGSNGYGNLSKTSGKFVITDGKTIGTSKSLFSVVCSAIPTNGYVSDYSEDENYAVIDCAKIKNNLTSATHVCIMFDMGVEKYVASITEKYNNQKELEWLKLSKENFPDGVITKDMLDKQTLKNIGDDGAIDKSKFRIVLMSDLHYKGFEGTKGYTSSERVSIAIDSLNKEYTNNGFDFVVFNGDVCNNDADTSTDIYKEITDIMDNTAIFPHYYLHASHDYYTETEFESEFGYTKNYTVRIGKNLLICIDNYGDSVNTVVNSGFGYKAVDMDWFNSVLDKNTDVENIFIVCHFLDTAKDTELVAKIDSTDKIICGFEGHIHDAITVQKGSKNFYRTGHFSITAGGTWSNDNPWGYRVVESDGKTISTYMVYPEVQYSDYTQPYQETAHVTIKTIDKPYSEFVVR